MSIRWRASGELLCAAVFPAEEGDVYIDDDQHYELSVLSGALVADVDHLPSLDGEGNGLWYWVDNPPFLRIVEGATTDQRAVVEAG